MTARKRNVGRIEVLYILSLAFFKTSLCLHRSLFPPSTHHLFVSVQGSQTTFAKPLPSQTLFVWPQLAQPDAPAPRRSMFVCGQWVGERDNFHSANLQQIVKLSRPTTQY